MADEPKNEEIKTPIEPVQLEEKNPEAGDGTPKTEVSEGTKKVEIEESELEKYKKKAADFDGLIEKQRLAKLNKKEEAPKDESEISRKLEEIDAKIAVIEKEKADNAMTDAYKIFATEMPWALGDEYFNKIVENFNNNGLKTKEEIVSRLRALTINLFPDKYSEQKEKEIKSKVLADAAKINAGNGGGSGNNEMGKGQEVVDPLAKLKERYNKSLPKGYTAIKK